MLDETFFSRADLIRSSDAFRPSLADYCHDVVASSEIVWPTHKMLNQSGRYLLAFMLVHNDYRHRRLGSPRSTLTTLQAMVGSSPRQTAAFVATLKAARFVTVEPDPDDARVRCLRAAPLLVAEIGRSGRLFVAAMDRLGRRHPGRAALLDDPDRLGELIYRAGAHILQHGMLTEPFARILALTARDCGYPLLAAVMGAHYAATVPDAPAALALSLRALANRFGVSRAHVGNLLQEADAAGWFRTEDRRLTRLDPSLLDEFEHWAACQMIFYDDLAAAICAEATAAP